MLIIGSGALACLFAARLVRVGYPVTMTGSWEAGMNAIRQNGVGLIEQEVLSRYPVHVLDISKPSSGFRNAIILVKAYQTRKTLERIRPHLHAEGAVLSLQNGLTARETMLAQLGEERTISGITLCAAEQIEPGVVRHNGGSAIFLGQHQGVETYHTAFSSAGFSASVTTDISRMIWEKAILNSAANPLGAILRLQNGQMAGLPDVMNIMEELIQEACAVASADGCDFDPSAIRQKMRQILEGTATNRCSMLQDILHQRETEVEDINGAIVNLGKKYRIPTPVQKTICQLVRSIQREA